MGRGSGGVLTVLHLRLHQMTAVMIDCSQKLGPLVAALIGKHLPSATSATQFSPHKISNSNFSCSLLALTYSPGSSSFHSHPVTILISSFINLDLSNQGLCGVYFSAASEIEEQRELFKHPGTPLQEEP